MAEKQQIGLVGVGNMGAPMARCLARAGNPVMLYDARPEVTAPLLAETNLFSAAPDLPSLGRACRTVVTMRTEHSAGREGFTALFLFSFRDVIVTTPTVPADLAAWCAKQGMARVTELVGGALL